MINSLTQDNIRNFCIIAHIDHGKSTLADRFLELTNTISKREIREQFLDNMDLERERGITIKLQAVRLNYTALDGKEYILNLIDTPGHVDFSYEVSRSLAACEGALLLVDASQGIEAQTLANTYMAFNHNLTIIPIVNKIDLPNADSMRVKKEIEDVLGISKNEILETSAKEGIGVKEVLEEIVRKIPSPKGYADKPPTALIFDSLYNPYLGVVVYIRMFSGELKIGMKIKMMGTEKEFEIHEIGYLKPKMLPTETLKTGEVGYLTANIKNMRDSRVGDTITSSENPALHPLPGYKEPKPMVFCGFFPVNADDYENLKDAIEKLHLNDASFHFEPETSQALGFGFRCGFLGLLHLEIVQERLEREYKINLLATAPSVTYEVIKTNGDKIIIDSPSKLPHLTEIDHIEEPYVSATIILPKEYTGVIMDLCQSKRGIFKNMEYLEETRAMLHYELPLNEIISDFYDQLKSSSRGYASLDYELSGYKPAELVKMDILVNEESVDALSTIVHKDKSYYQGRNLAKKLKELIPRQMFEVPIQAAIGGKIIARETVKAIRKNVTAKCYGGDITRKRKLLEKQKEGKKRMKRVGSVDIPQEAFLAVLKIKD